MKIRKPEITLDYTLKDWMFGFGIRFASVSQIPVFGYYVVSPFGIALFLGPLTLDMDFGEYFDVYEVVESV